MSYKRISLLVTATCVLSLSLVSIYAEVQSGPSSSVVRDIHGQVRFAEGGSPANNVLVKLESYDGGGSVAEVFTDRLGKFQFTNLSPAQYSVKIHQQGFRDVQQAVDLQTSSSGLVMLQLVKETTVGRPSVSTSIDVNVPPAAQKQFDKGVAALGQGGKDQLHAAVRCFEKAISIYPEFVEARLKLGTAYMDLSEWAKAETALTQTLEIDPNVVNALFALSEIFLRQNKIDQAERVLVKGLKIEDRSYTGHLNLARVYWERAHHKSDEAEAKVDFERAYTEVKRALQLNPNLGTAHLLKGNLLLRASRTNEALVEYDEYLRLEPNGPLALETRTLVDKIKRSTHHQSGSRN